VDTRKNLVQYFKCHKWFKCNFNHVYISFLTLFFKLIVKGEFYPKFVIFGIKVRHHVTNLGHKGYVDAENQPMFPRGNQMS
jgi:hypothetical protein